MAAEFGDIEQPAGIVREEPGEQHFVIRISEGFGDLVSQRFAWHESGSVGELARRIGGAEQAGEWYHHGYPVFPRMSHELGCLTTLLIRRGTDRSVDGLTLTIQTLQMCA